MPSHISALSSWRLYVLMKESSENMVFIKIFLSIYYAHVFNLSHYTFCIYIATQCVHLFTTFLSVRCPPCISRYYTIKISKNYVITSSIEEKIKPKTFCQTLTPTLFIRNSYFVLINLT